MRSASPRALGARQSLGQRGEAAAASYLGRIGFRVLERGYACRGGEIDLIAEEGDCLCFVEVRSRNPGPVRPFETVGLRKQRRLVAAARHYLAREGISPVGARALRFDVIEVNASGPEVLSIELCRNAFEVED